MGSTGKYVVTSKEMNSPRFKEACLRMGILKSELASKSFEDFQEDGLDRSIQKVRFEHYERKRNEKLRLVMETREKIFQEEEIKIHAQALESKTSYKKPDQVSDLLARERAQLDKIKLRQKQEVEQMMAYEMRVAKQIQENNRKLEKEAQEKRAKEELNRKRLKEEEERKRVLEQERKKALKEEEKTRRILMEKEARQAKMQAEKEKRREQDLRREARQREIEREKKKQQYKEATQQLFAEQQRLIEDKQRVMQKRDKERAAALREKQARMLAEHAEKQRLQMERVERTRLNQQKRDEEQRREFFMKQREAEKRQAEFEAKREADRLQAIERARKKDEEIQATREQMEAIAEKQKQKALEREEHIKRRLQQRELMKELQHHHASKAQEARDAARKAAFAQMLKNQEKKCEAIFRKRKLKEEAAAKRAAEQKVKDDTKDEIARLREQDRQESLERKKRMDAYNRKRLQEKIAEEEARVNRVKEERKTLLLKREEQRIIALAEKKKILEAFQVMRTTGKLDLPKGVDFESHALPLVDSTHPGKGIGTKTIRPSTAQPRLRSDRHSSNKKDKVKKPFQARQKKKGWESPRPNLETETKNDDESIKPIPDTAATTTATKIPSRPVSASILGRPEGCASPKKTKFLKKRKGKKVKTPETLRADIEGLRRRQNLHLLRILEQEQAKEKERETQLRKAKNAQARQVLDKTFASDRAKASARILRITQKHEAVMGTKMNELNRLIADGK